MELTREDEIWGMALWVERTQGENAPVYVAEQIGRLAVENDTGGIELWRWVAARLEELRDAAADNLIRFPT